ncbi:MAG: hypothetical protein ABSF26_25955 [Thermoguttaceae bacterium]
MKYAKEEKLRARLEFLTEKPILLPPRQRTTRYAPVIGHPNTSHVWMLRQWLETRNTR